MTVVLADDEPTVQVVLGATCGLPKREFNRLRVSNANNRQAG
jgi:hypothetical protein